jgi:hypothetical protein
MFRRITKPAVAALVLAAIGLLSAIGYSAIWAIRYSQMYGGGPSAFATRFLDDSAWYGSPYLGIGVIIAVFGRRHAASIVALFGTIVVTVGGVWLYLEGDPFISLLPIPQWMLVGVTALIMAVVSIRPWLQERSRPH